MTALPAHRTARVERATSETKLVVEVDLDGTGAGRVRDGCGTRRTWSDGVRGDVAVALRFPAGPRQSRPVPA